MNVKLVNFGVYVAFFSVAATCFADNISVDEFLPVVEGGEAVVQRPEAVTVTPESGVVQAATAQDAINAAVSKNKANVANSEDTEDTGVPQVGAVSVRFPSGLGFVATGAAAYRVSQNPVATRISQRQAAIVAFTAAKKNLAEYLDGLSTEGKNEIRESLITVVQDDGDLTNLSSSTESALRQAVEMTLRGFVLYEVFDDAENNQIFISIASTPKTIGRFSRPAANQVDAGSLRDGLAKVLAEVKSGLVMPVGGKIVTVPETGETAFIGFGSSVVRANKNAAVQAKLNLAAQKIAKAYAQDSLCGIIVGDNTVWNGEILDTYKSEHQEFVDLSEGDPLEAEGEELTKLEASRSEMKSTLRMTDAYSSARSGKLPPGVAVRTWFNNDKTWAYGMAVYVPSITNLAAGFRNDMQNAEILQLIQPREEVGGSKPGSVKSVNNDSVSRPSEKVKPLVSGRVGKDDL